MSIQKHMHFSENQNVFDFLSWKQKLFLLRIQSSPAFKENAHVVDFKLYFPIESKKGETAVKFIKDV